MITASAPDGRPGWAECSYEDGQFTQHWRTLGGVIDASSQQTCLVDVVQYIDGNDDLAQTRGPWIRIGETALRPAEAQRLIAMAQQGLAIIQGAAR